MALMHGKLGRIYWDCDAVRQDLEYAQNWTCDITHDVAEITSMQDTWKTYLGGYRDWSATVECLLDSAGEDITLGPGDPNGMCDTEAYLELYLKYDLTNTKYRALYGKAICNGMTFGADKDGIPTVTYSFEGVDQLTWYTSDAAVKVY